MPKPATAIKGLEKLHTMYAYSPQIDNDLGLHFKGHDIGKSRQKIMTLNGDFICHITHKQSVWQQGNKEYESSRLSY